MRSLRGRLILLLLAGITAALVAGGAAVHALAAAHLLSRLDESLADRAHTLAALVSREHDRLTFDWGDAPDELLGATWWELYDEAGVLLVRSSNLDSSALPRNAPAERATMASDVELPGAVRGRALWLGFRPRIDEDWEPPAGFETELLALTVAVDREPVDSALSALVTTLLIVGGAVELATLIIVFAGVRIGLAPLDRLSRQLPAISGRTISTRLRDARAPRELAPIYRELNSMLDRVEHALDRERSFADATAHELRTPLAELRATAEVAVRWPEPDRAIASLHEVLAIGHEMERLVESLLLISRGHAEEPASETPDVALSPIVGRLLQREAESIRAKRIDVAVDVSESASMHAPPEAVEIILRNLINNAVHYTPAGGRIGVRGQSRNGNGAALVVENDPVALRESDLPLLFRPFWRADGSRSDRAHAGLGLAVVQQIAHATGLEVAASLHGDRLAILLSAAMPQAARDGDGVTVVGIG